MNTPEHECDPDDKDRTSFALMFGRAIGDFFRVLNLAEPGRAARLYQAGRLFPGAIATFSFIAAILMLVLERIFLPASAQISANLPDAYLVLAFPALAIITLVANVVPAIPLYIAARLFAGKGSFPATVAVACAISIALAPISVLLEAAFYAMPGLSERWHDFPRYASSIVLLGIWVRPMANSLAQIHHMSNSRSLLAIIVSVVIMVAAAYGFIALFGKEIGLA